jgi:hypothetical protein
MSENNPIVTELGKLDGRDGIYLDGVKQCFSPNKLTFVGEINGDLCTNNPSGHRWFAYELSFNRIQAFDCRELEICKWKVESSFDEIQDSELITELRLDEKGYQHYILSTYDYVYSIIAKGYELKITGYRNG